jgi:hypothetical protein
MSVIELADAKAFLDVIHSGDDGKLQMLLDGAEQEALDFMNRTEFEPCAGAESSSSEPPEMSASVKIAVLLLLQASYQATPDDAAKLRRVAEIKLFASRCNMGV